jgi:nucleoside phosphorylase
MRRVSGLLAVVLIGACTGIFQGLSADPTASAATTTALCTPRLLILSAMPLEEDPLISRAVVNQHEPFEFNHRVFYLGTLEGNNIIIGLTGVGPANALITTTDAFSTFRCGGKSTISGVVFSGTSGGDYIGDVFVPSRWTENNKSFVAADPTMLAVARQAVKDGVGLERTTPTGDPVCACGLTGSLDVNTPIEVKHVPEVEFGGTGLTTDPFGGRALPCLPVSDLFGCAPCVEPNNFAVSQSAAFVTGILPFLQASFISSYLDSTNPAGTFVSEDNETAVVAQVAQGHGVPFIGFRAASDGGGDPLGLPGYPSQFFVYAQLAANNAASTALGFLKAWSLRDPVVQ